MKFLLEEMLIDFGLEFQLKCKTVTVSLITEKNKNFMTSGVIDSQKLAQTRWTSSLFIIPVSYRQLMV